MFVSCTRRLAGLLAKIATDRRGNLAIIFAFCLVPLALLIGGAIDLRRALTSKAYMQDASDSAALAGAKAYYMNATQPLATRQAAAKAAADKAMNALLGLRKTIILQPGWTLVENDATGAVTLTAAAQSPASFGGLFHIAYVPINTVSTATAGGGVHLELALVLDNTGSMGDPLGGSNKLTSLKAAANQLVDTLSAAAAHSPDPNVVKIAVAPFSMTVNVGSTYQNASWMTGTQPAAYGQDLFTSAQNRFTLLSNMHLTWGGCVELRPAPYDVQDTAPTSGATLFVPFFAPDEPDANSILKSGSTYYSFNNNYITDDYPAPNYSSSTTYAVGDEVKYSGSPYVSLKAANKNKTPSSNGTYWRKETVTHDGVTSWQTRQGNPTKYAAGYTYGVIASGASGTSVGPNAGCTMTPVLRLTNNFTTVKSKISAMVANGNTNVPMGLAWGWHLLSPNTPFADGSAYGTPNVNKVVVLLTDGDNTNDVYANPENSIYLGVGYIWQGRLLNALGTALGVTSTADDRRDAMDSRFTLLCSNMKAKNITIYTIGVGVSSHSSSILQGCATTSDKYYNVTDASQLTSVFNSIAASISNLRLAQ